MNERFITFACALGALALFLAMLIPGDEGTRGGVPRPTSPERQPNGYYGAMTWLDKEHIRTVSVRDRFNELAVRPTLPASGNLLVVTLPAVTPFKTEELRSLESWIRAGNTVLVLAALSDNPNWAVVAGHPAASDLALLAGLEFEIVRSRPGRVSRGAAGKRGVDEVGARVAAAAKAFVHPRRVTLIPDGPYAGYFEGVHAATALSDYPAQAWAVKIPYDGFALSLAHEPETGEPVLWVRPLGDGKIIVSGLGSLFTNRALGLADNGQLLANIVAASLRQGGALLFDDMHQGLSMAYDSQKFYSDWRLYLTIGILTAVWLCWVLGPTKLRLPVTRTPAPREAELVQASGAFLARVVTTDLGARGLFDHFFRRLRERLPRVPGSGTPPWELLEERAGVTADDLRQLRDWYAAAVAARPIPLQRLHNLLVKVERHLTA